MTYPLISRFHCTFSVALMVATSSGCGMTATGNPKKPIPPGVHYAVPPAATLDFDFGPLVAPTPAALSLLETQWAFGVAKLSLDVIGAYVASYTAIPLAAIVAASNQPERVNPDKSTSRVYSFESAGIRYQAKLDAQSTSQGGRDWKLYITKVPADGSGCCANFLWLTGQENGSTGLWTMNDITQPATLTPRARVDWKYSSVDQREVKMTALNIGILDNGWKDNGFLKFSRAGEQTEVLLDKAIDDTAVLKIDWSEKTLDGGILGEDGRHLCWNTEKNDVACAAE